MKAFYTLLLASVLLLSGCQTSPISKASAFPHMYDDQRPLTILMLPPVNKTTAADAKELYTSTAAEPITQHGYYFFPPAVVFDLFKQEGIYDTETILNTPPQIFGQKFGADAILLVEITEWNTTYMILGAYVSVGLNMKLLSTRSGETIWERYSLVVVDTSGGSNSGGGLVGLLAKAIATAVTTAITDYVPIARQANQTALLALPHGKYHSRHNLDKNDEFVPIKRAAAAKADGKGAAEGATTAPAATPAR